MNYYNDDSVVFINGKFVKVADANISVYAQSLHYGYAVFEGIRAYQTPMGTQLFKGAEHYQRLKRSCDLIYLPLSFSAGELEAITYKLLELNKLNEAYIRPLVYAAKPDMSLSAPSRSDVLISVWSWGKYLGDRMLRLMISSHQRPNPLAVPIESKCSGQYANSIIASSEAKMKGYDEALLLDSEGNIAEGPGANFFMEKEGVLYTPPTGNILPGITRDVIIELAANRDIPVKIEHIRPEDLKEADSAFFTGTASEVVGIHSVNDIILKKKFWHSKGSLLAKDYTDLVKGMYSKESLLVQG
jgi:branched-chain amino acid aminotransferase